MKHTLCSLALFTLALPCLAAGRDYQLPSDSHTMMAIDKSDYQAVIPDYTADAPTSSLEEGVKQTGHYYMDPYSRTVKWKWDDSQADNDPKHTEPLDPVRVIRGRTLINQRDSKVEMSAVLKMYEGDDDPFKGPYAAAPEPSLFLGLAVVLPLFVKKRVFRK